MGPKTQNIIPPLLTHNILVSKRKILLLREDLPPITGNHGSCNRITILPRERNSFFAQEDFFRRNFILGPEDRFSECIWAIVLARLVRLSFERSEKCTISTRALERGIIFIFATPWPKCHIPSLLHNGNVVFSAQVWRKIVYTPRE